MQLKAGKWTSGKMTLSRQIFTYDKRTTVSIFTYNINQLSHLLLIDFHSTEHLNINSVHCNI